MCMHEFIFLSKLHTYTNKYANFSRSAPTNSLLHRRRCHVRVRWSPSARHLRPVRLRQEHAADQAARRTAGHVRPVRVAHDAPAARRRNERRRVPLRDRRPDERGDCARRLPGDGHVQWQPVRHQQAVGASGAAPGQGVRAGHRDRGRQADPGDRPESAAGVRAAAVGGRAGAASARAQNGDGGELAEATGYGEGRDRVW